MIDLLMDSLLTPIVESTYLNRDMCKFESSQKDESRWQSTDSSKAYRNTSAFKCRSDIVYIKQRRPVDSTWSGLNPDYDEFFWVWIGSGL